MQSRKSPSVSASDRRQRLQIGGGALAVAVIWILALWPSGDDMAGQSGPSAPASPVPWTTGPFVGTTPTTAGQRPTPGGATTSTISTSAGATTPPAPGTTPTTQVGVVPAPGGASKTSPVRTTQVVPEPEWTPPGQANKSTRPPKALDISDVLTID